MTTTRQLVLGDLGGSYLRFALANDDLERVPRYRKSIHEIEKEFELRKADSPFYMALRDFLDDMRSEGSLAPSAEIDLWLSLPCDVAGHVHVFENLGRSWTLDRHHLKSAFGLHRVVAINDFEAIAWSIPKLAREAAFAPIGDPQQAEASGRIVVIGPGTALGAAALIPDSKGFYLPVATEFGHTSAHDSPAIEQLRDRLSKLVDRAEGEGVHIKKLKRRYGLDADHFPPSRRYRREFLTSGPGIERLYDATAQEVTASAPPAIVVSAKESSDPAAVTAIGHFCELLGRDAAALAATFTARGGVLLVGSIANALGADELVRFGMREAFDNAFERKDQFPRHVPLELVRHPNPGLVGLARLAKATLASGR